MDYTVFTQPIHNASKPAAPIGTKEIKAIMKRDGRCALKLENGPFVSDYQNAGAKLVHLFTEFVPSQVVPNQSKMKLFMLRDQVLYNGQLTYPRKLLTCDEVQNEMGTMDRIELSVLTERGPLLNNQNNQKAVEEKLGDTPEKDIAVQFLMGNLENGYPHRSENHIIRVPILHVASICTFPHRDVDRNGQPTMKTFEDVLKVCLNANQCKNCMIHALTTRYAMEVYKGLTHFHDEASPSKLGSHSGTVYLTADFFKTALESEPPILVFKRNFGWITEVQVPQVDKDGRKKAEKDGTSKVITSLLMLHPSDLQKTQEARDSQPPVKRFRTEASQKNAVKDIEAPTPTVQQHSQLQTVPIIAMSTSVKHREFIGEPMGEKEVTCIAGIGPTYGTKLTDAGYDKAYVLFGQFLLLKKDEELFVEWLKETAGVTANHARSAYNCLKEWSDQFM